MDMEWITLRRPDVINRLRQLRLEMEEEMTSEQALLLVDVCRAMGLNESETAVVMGRAYSLFEFLRNHREGRRRAGSPT